MHKAPVHEALVHEAPVHETSVHEASAFDTSVHAHLYMRRLCTRLCA